MNNKNNIKISIGGRSFPPKLEVEFPNSYEGIFKVCLVGVAMYGTYYFFKSWSEYWLYKKKNKYSSNVTNKQKEDTQEPPAPRS